MKKEKTIAENTPNKPRKRLIPPLGALIKDIIAYLVGACLYAISVNVFTAPNEIAPGGVTGIATMINSFYSLPIGSLMMVINIPLFILGFFLVGWRYILRTIVCLGMVSVAIDLSDMLLPVYTGDLILAAIFGGVLMGLALGVVFMRGGSTGGTDIIARVFGKLFPQVTQGKLLLLIDLLVIGAAAIVYDLEAGLYALIALFVSSFALDRVLYGSATGKMMFIISAKTDEINDMINEELGRGTTRIQAKGGYSGGEREVIMCAVRRNESFKIRSLVKKIDPDVFIIMGDATEILGEGFKPINENEFGEQS